MVVLAERQVLVEYHDLVLVPSGERAAVGVYRAVLSQCFKQSLMVLCSVRAMSQYTVVPAGDLSDRSQIQPPCSRSNGAVYFSLNP